MSYFSPYIDNAGVHLPTYEDRLAQLLDDYRRIFGSDLVLTEDTQDYQLCSVFAKALDDLSSLMLESYASRDPDLASGQTLDLLLPLNNVTRLPGESDTSARLRRSYAVAAPGQSTKKSLEAALRAVPNVTDVMIWENDTGSTDSRGLPAHSVHVVIKGGLLSDIGEALYAHKPVGVSTTGSSSVMITDEYGADHFINFSRPANKSVVLNIYLKTLSGFDATNMPARIKTAVAAYAAKLKIGQDLLVPSLYTPVMAQDDPAHPTFLITGIVASTTSSSSQERITAGPAERINITEGIITVHTEPINMT